jgi:hypothetical protein
MGLSTVYLGSYQELPKELFRGSQGLTSDFFNLWRYLRTKYGGLHRAYLGDYLRAF